MEWEIVTPAGAPWESIQRGVFSFHGLLKILFWKGSFAGIFFPKLKHFLHWSEHFVCQIANFITFFDAVEI